jgi:uncharacterized RDD family membrane protein YckC
MVLLLAGIQLATPAAGMPPALWFAFSAVWIFGAAMLWWFPMFGAWGTALYGVILGVNVLQMHGGRTSTWLVAAGSFLATVLALAVYLELRRNKKSSP